MNERADYYRNKFIRNGIVGIAISGFLIYNAITVDKTFSLILIIFPLFASVWLYFGLKINHKMKLKSSQNEIESSDERVSFKSIEFFFSLLIITSILLSVKHWKYANYLTVTTLAIYITWVYKQMKILNDYFKISGE